MRRRRRERRLGDRKGKASRISINGKTGKRQNGICRPQSNPTQAKRGLEWGTRILTSFKSRRGRRRSEKRNYPTLATEARMGHQKLGPETRMGAKFGWAHLSRGLGGMI